jgi:hypothetical protein
MNKNRALNELHGETGKRCNSIPRENCPIVEWSKNY